MNKTFTTQVQYVVIAEDYAGQRIDNYLINKLKTVPKSRIYRILRKGEVRVNKKRAKPDYRLQAGDQLRLPPLQLTEKPLPPKPGQSLATLLVNRILYEDKNLLIINKPSGIAVHGGSSVKLGIVEAMRIIFPEYPQLELAHRLDLETSGCLILAKKRSILRELHELLRLGKVTKIYATLTKGHWQSSEYEVDVPLQKNHLKSGERIVRVDSEGKSSLTIFKPLKEYADATFLEVFLHTGRTHQIRVHAAYRKHPVAGDDKYGDKNFNKQMKQIGLNRLFLHAKLIDFVLPSTGERIQITAPLDEDLEGCLELL